MTSTIIYGALWIFLAIMAAGGAIMAVVAALDRRYLTTAAPFAMLFGLFATLATTWVFASGAVATQMHLI